MLIQPPIGQMPNLLLDVGLVVLNIWWWCKCVIVQGLLCLFAAWPMWSAHPPIGASQQLTSEAKAQKWTTRWTICCKCSICCNSHLLFPRGWSHCDARPSPWKIHHQSFTFYYWFLVSLSSMGIDVKWASVSTIMLWNAPWLIIIPLNMPTYHLMMFINIAKCKTFSRKLDTPHSLAWIIKTCTLQMIVLGPSLKKMSEHP
jgi:hypothetical protein